MIDREGLLLTRGSGPATQPGPDQALDQQREESAHTAPDQFARAVTVRRWAVHLPEHPSDDTDQLPEPEAPNSLPEAEP